MLPFLATLVVALLRAWQPSGSTNGQRTFLVSINRFLASWPNFSSEFLSWTRLTGQPLSRWSLPGHPGLGQFLLPLSPLFSVNPLKNQLFLLILRFINGSEFLSSKSSSSRFISKYVVLRNRYLYLLWTWKIINYTWKNLRLHNQSFYKIFCL